MAVNVLKVYYAKGLAIKCIYILLHHHFTECIFLNKNLFLQIISVNTSL